MEKRYQSPSNWPSPPPGWVPPAGWEPDPAWGPPPEDHQFWVDVPPTAGLTEPQLPPRPGGEPQTQHSRGGEGPLAGRVRSLGAARVSRVILGTLLALLLVITWFGASPNRLDAGSPADASSDLAAAEIIYDSNNERTEGAPQQAVVNGWYANDLGVIQASQTSYLGASSARNGNLLVLIGLGIAGELIIRGMTGANTTRNRHEPADRTEATA